MSKISRFKQETLNKGLDKMAHYNIEWLLPLTHVEEEFRGDRFGEKNKKQEKDMDFYAQARLHHTFTFEFAEQFPNGFPAPPITTVPA
jgi:hypothetical protein